MSPPIRRPWSAAEIAELAARYPHESTAAIARDMGRSVEACYAQAVGLRKSPEYMASPKSGRMTSNDRRGVDTQFRSGQDPWNKSSGADTAPEPSLMEVWTMQPHCTSTVIAERPGVRVIQHLLGD